MNAAAFPLRRFVASSLRRFALCVVLALCAALSAAPRGNPPAPVAAAWDATTATLTIEFDAAISIPAPPPLPVKAALEVTAGAQHWTVAQTIEIGESPAGANRLLWVTFSDPVSADPPADGAVCAYGGAFLVGEQGRVQPFAGFPCAQ